MLGYRVCVTERSPTWLQGFGERVGWQRRRLRWGQVREKQCEGRVGNEVFCPGPIKFELLPGFSFVFYETRTMFVLYISKGNQM